MNEVEMREYIFQEIQQELANQKKKWGEQNHKGIEWIAILTEEVGEASKEIVDYHFKHPVKGPNGEKLPPLNGDQGIRLSNYRQELIQIAATAISMIESVERNGE